MEEQSNNINAKSHELLTQSQIDDIRLAASKMYGPERRSFQAEMCLKYCDGVSRLAESIFVWGRENVEKGLAEKRTGIICIGSQSALCGNKRWEEKHPEAAEALNRLAELHSQQDPTFHSTIAYTRLTAKEAINQLREMGFSEDELPSLSSMAKILNRSGYRLRLVVKAKPQKKIPETDAIFANIKEQEQKIQSEFGADNVKRLSIDCKATVKIGDYSRGGKTRGNNEGCDHDMGCKEKYTPFGILCEVTGELDINFGSSHKTSDFIVDSLNEWWNRLTPQSQQQIKILQIKSDNGPESSGVRTQFLNRIVQFVDSIGKPVHLLYYPPYHSKYNPIERCWGILELHWNGSLLNNAETMFEWAKSMTWKGINPVINLTHLLQHKI